VLLPKSIMIGYGRHSTTERVSANYNGLSLLVCLRYSLVPYESKGISHAGITVCTIAQYFKAVSPLLRGNLDILIYFRTLRDLDRQSICSEYLCYSDDKEVKKQGFELMESITKVPHQAMIVNKKIAQFCNSHFEYIHTLKAPKKYKHELKVFPYDTGKQLLTDEDLESERNRVKNLFHPHDQKQKKRLLLEI